jgi:hypothetical protein
LRAQTQSGVAPLETWIIRDEHTIEFVETLNAHPNITEHGPKPFAYYGTYVRVG